MGHLSLGQGHRWGDLWRRVHLRVQLRLMLCVGEVALGDSGLDLRRQSLVLWSHRLDLHLDQGLDQALVGSLSFGSLALGGLGGDRGSSNIYQKERTGRCIRLASYGV